MTISSKRYKPQHPKLFDNNMLINELSIPKYLGIILSCNLSWRPHILSIYEKASKMLNFLKEIQFKVSRDTLMKLNKSLIRPLMEYADVIWDGCNEDDSELIESVQYEAARMVMGAMRGTSRSRLLHEVAWEEMKIRRKLHKLVFYFKIKSRLVPSYLSELIPCTGGQRKQISPRTSDNLRLHPTHTERFKKSFFPIYNKAVE